MESGKKRGSKIGAVIAAAGKSSRMAAFKPLLPLRGRTMIEMTLAPYQAVKADEIVVVVGYRREEIKAHLKNQRLICLDNPHYETNQMFDSICLGIQLLKNRVDYLFITPGDVPLVKPATLNAMLEQIRKGEGGCIQPVYQGRKGHPLLIKRACFEMILAHDGTRGLQGAVKTLGSACQSLACDDPGIVMDADTREDYVKLKQM